ncbi:MAG: hypothetical protein H0V92_00445 [Pseudonocardiales bacterium]|nr:hypothetical protein [Pseudonocardiales bacterium]
MAGTNPEQIALAITDQRRQPPKNNPQVNGAATAFAQARLSSRTTGSCHEFAYRPGDPAIGDMTDKVAIRPSAGNNDKFS